MRPGDRTTTDGATNSALFITVPSNLPPPILNHRWASESSSQMFGDPTDPAHRAGVGTTGRVASTGVVDGGASAGNRPTDPNSKAGSCSQQQSAQQQAVGGATEMPGGAGGGGDGGGGGADDEDDGMMGLVGTTQKGPRGFNRTGRDPQSVSPWERSPPPPPPVFDISIPRQRFIAKIMRWYQVVELWAQESGFVRFDRDRLVVAPPPRPPLFAEGHTFFGLPEPARALSPYNVNDWATACHRWWHHVHAHFHRIQTQQLGQTVVKSKATALLRTPEQMAALVSEQAIVDLQDVVIENGAE